ncbi:MAG: LptF/LptG family permease [Phycisphaerae bacterium]|nr:LptF/LptG family permease [Phycisphaerae bacterium]MDD5380682.1 LptF/LptG family permease [Phycisphaerae bacterium]
MVFTLHRYIFRELLKVFVPSAVALTLMLSLGSVLRPIQEYGVGPRQVVHLMGYFLPVTLTFVLPMAALFAATLVYGRFASDNELDACKAGGVSLLTLVYPGLVLAIIVSIANLVLSFYVMPAFVQRAEKSLKADAKQILFRNLQRSGYYKLPPDGRYRIYADLANSWNNTLSGVIVVGAKDSRIEKIIAAERAELSFDPHERFNEVRITAYNTYQMGLEGESPFSAERVPLTMPFPPLMGDDIKFKKIDEMKKIRLDLMSFDPIAKLAIDTYAQLTVELLADDITKKISVASEGNSPSLETAEDTNSFYKLHSGEKLVEFTADQCKVIGEEQVQLSGKVVVIEHDAFSKKVLRTLRCATASLHIEGDKLAPTLTMDIRSPTWQLVDGSEGLAQRVIIRGLVLPKTVTDKFVSADVLKTVSRDSIKAALPNGPSSELDALQNRLQRKIQGTLADIRAELHSRLVFGIGCVALMMIGIGLGIILKGGHLLSAFGASSLPAVVLIVCIMMGKNITKNPYTQVSSGIVLMWASVIFLSVVAVIMYRKLLRN